MTRKDWRRALPVAAAFVLDGAAMAQNATGAPGATPAAPVAQFGQRQARGSVPDAQPLARIQSRIQNRVQSRINSRIDRTAAPSGAADAYTAAAEQAATSPR